MSKLQDRIRSDNSLYHSEVIYCNSLYRSSSTVSDVADTTEGLYQGSNNCNPGSIDSPLQQNGDSEVDSASRNPLYINIASIDPVSYTHLTLPTKA